jgi:hypothetical protein
MRHKLLAVLSLAASLTLNTQFSTAFAQGTAFSYQGQLNNGATPVNGSYDMTFSLFNTSNGVTAAAGPVTETSVAVSNGLFTVLVDFGPAFTNGNAWLSVGVRSNGSVAFINLSPLQQITPTPYALEATSLMGGGGSLTGLNASQLTSGTVPVAHLPASVALLNATQTFTGTNTFSAVAYHNGGIVVNSTNGFGQSSLGSFSIDAPSFPGGRFIVTTNGNVGIGTANPATNLEVNGAAQIDGAAQVNGGAQIGGVAKCNGGIVVNSTNGFGQSSLGSFSIDAPSFSGGRFIVTTNGKVGIGTSNPSGTLTLNGTNGFSQSAEGAFSIDAPNISGGRFIVTTNGNVGIGLSAPNTEKLVVAGGVDFTTAATSPTNDFGMGLSYESYGGRIQTFQTKPLILNPLGNNVGIGITSPTNLLQVANAYCNGSSWVNASDRNLKQDFASVDGAAVLEKIVGLPIQSWSYKTQPDEKHIGPVAQDFHAVFGLNGADDKHIATVDESGVALAAIQGLNQKMEDSNQKSEVRIQKLESENTDLKKRLEQLEQLLTARSGGGQ